MGLNNWKNRWKITGVLTTASPLHIGDGGETERKNLKFEKLLVEGENEKKWAPVRIASVATDVEVKPYIPGSTLKGNLRAWLEKYAGADIVEALLGSRDSGRKDAVGGKCDFWNARFTGPAPTFDPSVAPPWWDPSRLTGVWAGVAIDRLTGAAEDKKLFHHEFVPPRVSFSVTIIGQDLSDEQAGAILNALEAFNHHEDGGDRLTLGAATGDGWGWVDWVLLDAVCIETSEVEKWLDDAGAGVWTAIPGKSRRDVLKAWSPRGEVDRRSKIVINLELQFEGPFLVNDPSRTKHKSKENADDRPDHVPLRDSRGRAFLPAQSFRGAIRSQAERILRTIGGGKAACAGTPAADGLKSCKAVYDVNKVAIDLCLACRVFGAPGWNSPIGVSDFVGPAEDDNFFQDFVAIDRFTGGAADKAKFDALAAYRPVLKGSLSIDLQSLGRAGVGDWALGLIALTLRDLIEGEVSFGFGMAKGYGRCRARTTVHGRDLAGDWSALAPDRAAKVDDDWIKPLVKTIDEWAKNACS